MSLKKLRLGPDCMDPIEKFEIFNTTKQHLRSLPTGVVHYPYTFLLTKEGYDSIQSFLSSRIDFKEQPEIVTTFERRWDWACFESRAGRHAALIFFISVSHKVFMDTEFRGLIMEEII